MDINLDNIVVTAGNYDFSVDEENKYIRLNVLQEQCQDIISIMKEHCAGFNVDAYKVIANEYTGNTGTVKV